MPPPGMMGPGMMGMPPPGMMPMPPGGPMGPEGMSSRSQRRSNEYDNHRYNYRPY